MSEGNLKPRGRDGFKRVPPRGVLSIVVVIVGGGLFAYGHWSTSAFEIGTRYETSIGQLRSIELADGSRVVLDTDSEIVTRYSARRRNVELVRGQAQFTVMKDSRRRFEVNAAGATVTAVGTAFQVRAEQEKHVVTGAVVRLLEGRIAIEGPRGAHWPQSPAHLVPGQQLRFDHEGRWSLTEVNLTAANAWPEGLVHARNWRLIELVNEMNRYSKTKVHCLEPTVGELRVSGVFRTGDPEAWVRALERSLPVYAWLGPNADILLSYAREKQKPSAPATEPGSAHLMH